MTNPTSPAHAGIDPNSSAFPHWNEGPLRPGFTKREEIAARAMEALLSNPNVIGFNSQFGWGLVNCDVGTFSDYCLVHADALISALNKENEK